MAWVKYDIKLVGRGGGGVAQNVQDDSRCKGIQGITSKTEIKCMEHNK